MKRALAGESTKDSRATFAAIAWATGYVGNCAGVLVVLHLTGHFEPLAP